MRSNLLPSWESSCRSSWLFAEQRGTGGSRERAMNSLITQPLRLCQTTCRGQAQRPPLIHPQRKSISSLKTPWVIHRVIRHSPQKAQTPPTEVEFVWREPSLKEVQEVVEGARSVQLLGKCRSCNPAHPRCQRVKGRSGCSLVGTH